MSSADLLLSNLEGVQFRSYGMYLCSEKPLVELPRRRPTTQNHPSERSQPLRFVGYIPEDPLVAEQPAPKRFKLSPPPRAEEDTFPPPTCVRASPPTQMPALQHYQQQTVQQEQQYQDYQEYHNQQHFQQQQHYQAQQFQEQQFQEQQFQEQRYQEQQFHEQQYHEQQFQEQQFQEQQFHEQQLQQFQEQNIYHQHQRAFHGGLVFDIPETPPHQFGQDQPAYSDKFQPEAYADASSYQYPLSLVPPPCQHLPCTPQDQMCAPAEYLMTPPAATSCGGNRSSSEFSCAHPTQIQTQAFPTRAPFVMPASTQQDQRPWACDVPGCGKAYTDKSSLTKHKRKHSGERPHVCEICGRAFTLVAHLTRHRLIHTGEKPHACPVEGCEKRFVRVDDLKTHIRVHTGERPYICPIDGCRKAFTQASALARHRRTQHTVQKF